MVKKRAMTVVLLSCNLVVRLHSSIFPLGDPSSRSVFYTLVSVFYWYSTGACVLLARQTAFVISHLPPPKARGFFWNGHCGDRLIRLGRGKTQNIRTVYTRMQRQTTKQRHRQDLNLRFLRKQISNLPP